MNENRDDFFDSIFKTLRSIIPFADFEGMYRNFDMKSFKNGPNLMNDREFSDVPSDSKNIRISYRFDSQNSPPKIQISGDIPSEFRVKLQKNLESQFFNSNHPINLLPSPEMDIKNLRSDILLPDQDDLLFTDIYSTQDGISIIVDVPCISKEEINLSFLDGKLEIQHPQGIHRISLPPEADPSEIKARFHNGILEVKMQRMGSIASEKQSIPLE